MAERVGSGMMRDEKGQSVVEFALLVPILLLLLCGIFDIGRLMFGYISLNMTAQEAVRLGGLGHSDADITAYAKSHLRLGDPTKLKVTISPLDSTRKSGQDVTVALNCPLPLVTPLLSRIIPAPAISASSTIRVE